MASVPLLHGQLTEKESAQAGRANHTFADGQAENRALAQSFALTNSVDAWNPLTAR